MPYRSARRAPRRRLNPVAATAAHLAFAAGRAAVKKYGARAAAAGLAGAAGYSGFKIFKKKPARRMTIKPLVDGSSARKRPRGGDGDSGDAAQGGFVQEATRTMTSGKKASAAAIIQRLSTKDMLSRTLFWKNVPAFFSGASGTMWLSNNNSLVASTALPVYLCNLTQNAGASVPAMTRLNVGTGTNPGVVFWSQVSGQDAAGASSTTHSILRQSPDYPVYAQPWVHYGATHVNFVLYGNTTKNTTFKLSLVQFTDESIAPFSDIGVSNTGTLTSKHNQFWGERVRRYITHPLELSVKLCGKYMKVLKTATFKIAPQSSTDLDTNPHHIIVKWTHNINKMVNMRLTGAAPTTAVEVYDAQKNPTDATGAAGLLSQAPRVKDRVYALIECNDWVAGSTDNNASAPSFDFTTYTTQYVTV